jgi:hypothetical protein
MAHLEKRKLTPVASPRKSQGSRGTVKHRNLCESNASGRGAVLQPQPGPSNVLSRLSALSKRVPTPTEPEAPIRTSSFADKARWAPFSRSGIDPLIIIQINKAEVHQHVMTVLCLLRNSSLGLTNTSHRRTTPLSGALSRILAFV